VVVQRRTSTAATAYLKAGNSQNDLQKRIERWQQSKPLKERRTDHLHPSVIVKKDWCYRDAYYTLKHGDNLEQRNNLRSQNIFDEGHAIHDKWQRRFWDMGELVGDFFCPHCHVSWWATSPHECPGCGMNWHHLLYQEVSLEDPELMIKGHTDGWLKDRLIEIKSIGAGTLRFEDPALLAEHGTDLEAAWRAIKRPFGTHVRQGMLYLYLAQKKKETAGLVPPTQIDFIYELKSNQDYKFFTVKYDPKVVRKVLEGAALVTKAFKEDKAPECNQEKCKCGTKWEKYL
jgi:hypothetical protein